jgi:hydrogenase maturation factor
MKGIVDRFEGELVVVEIDGVTKDYSIEMFPKDIEVGDVVRIEGNLAVIEKEQTKKLRNEIEKLMADVWED